MEFFIKDLFSKCEQIRSFLSDFVTFTVEILHGKIHFLCSEITFFTKFEHSYLTTLIVELNKIIKHATKNYNSD